MTDTDTTTSEVVIKAISNEIRRNIIRLLIDKQLSYTEIAHLLNFELRRESGKFNFHLKELVQAGLIDNTTTDETYKLTDKGTEVYYLLLDIEKDREIDPHGLMTALIKLEGKKEFFFFVAVLAIVAGLQALLIGLVGLFGLGFYLQIQIVGGILSAIGLVIFVWGVMTYSRILNELLAGRSRSSRIASAIFFLSVEWYFIRGTHRLAYLFALFFGLLGWITGLLTMLLGTAKYVGREQVGGELYVIASIAAISLLAGLLQLRRLFNLAKQVDLSQKNHRYSD